MLTVDANVVHGYYRFSVLGHENPLTADPSPIFEAVGIQIVVDDENHVEADWKSSLPSEWFDAWYATLLIEDRVRLIPVDPCTQLLNRLYQLGFPRSNDKWYVRVAAAACAVACTIPLVTEDLDFVEPREKKAPSRRRRELLEGSAGSVRKRLKGCGILVQSVSTFLESTVNLPGATL